MSLTTKVSSSFWSDEDIGSLPPAEKLSLLWVLTNKDRNNLGLVKVGKRQFEFDTGAPLSTLQGALNGLTRSFAFREVESGLEVLSINFIHYQFADVQANPSNRIYKHLCTQLSVADDWVKKVLLARYKGLVWGLSSGSPLQGACKPLEGTRAEQSRAEQSLLDQEGGMQGGKEVPTDAQVRAWALAWPGESATGTPGFPENFVAEWLGRMNGRTMGWPVDWKRALVADWRAKFRDWGKGRPGAGGRSMYDLKDRLRALEAQIASHPANETSTSAIGEPSETERQELQKMRAERTALAAQIAGVSP